MTGPKEIHVVLLKKKCDCDQLIRILNDFRNNSKIMSLTGTASRFACLPDDDSADWKGLKQKQKKEDAKKNQTKPKDSNKAKVQNESKELQNLAFGAPKKKNKKKNPNKEKKTSRSATSQDKEESQFEEWKERDKALENDNFTAAMQVDCNVT